MHPELRLHPRMPVEIPAEVVFPSGDTTDITLLSISLGGLTSEGDGRAFTLFENSKPRFPLEIEMHFGLVDRPIRCHCRLIYTQRLKQDLYAFGFKLLSLDLLDQQYIREKVEEYELTRL